MKKRYIRLDDACPKRDIDKWNRMERLLDQYNIKPLVGIIPACKDPAMEQYEEDPLFWDERVPMWQAKGWIMALHGYEHVFSSDDGGLNPVNKRSEFAGIPLSEQKEKIKNGLAILKKHRIIPTVFFAPAHTYDINTLKALEAESNIRIISDTPGYSIYYEHGFSFIPQQSGRVRKLPFKITTFCYHPNIMNETDFEELEEYIKHYGMHDFEARETKRNKSALDVILMKLYYFLHNQ